jgi:hypothetical protein
MVTGQTPFRGPSAEVMYQHQQAPLPRERLKDVPQPVVVLLEKLLEKDPAHSSAAGLYQIFNRINADRRRRSAGAHHAGEQLDRITLEM